VARAAAPTDPELAQVWSYREDLRIEGYRRFVGAIAGHLPAGVDPDRAADVLIAMLAPGLYVMLQQRGWDDEQIVDWLADAIPTLMLRPAA